MADENIHVKITGSNRPSSIGGGTPSSFASVTGAAGGGDARAIIRADAAIVTSQNSLADAIKQLRTAIAASATNSAERAALENRRRALMLQQRSLLSGGESVITGSAGAAERRSMTAMMPGSALHRAGRSLLGATRSAWSGDMGGTFGHIGNLAGGFGLRSMISRFGAGASGGAAEGAIAGAAGVEGVEAAGSLAALIGAPALTAAGIGVGLAGLGGLGYEAYKHRDTLKALPYALPTLLAARRYGPEEVDRQGEAYRAARLFGESGRSIVSATLGGARPQPLRSDFSSHFSARNRGRHVAIEPRRLSRDALGYPHGPYTARERRDGGRRRTSRGRSLEVDRYRRTGYDARQPKWPAKRDQLSTSHVPEAAIRDLRGR